MHRHSIPIAACVVAATTCAALPPAARAAATGSPPELKMVVVTATHLGADRARISTRIGASSYTFDSRAIAGAPGGDNAQLNQVILQAPDVAQDSFGQIHVRGEHNGVQYRINGIVLPEGVSAFGQVLDPRLISSVSLITGTLPAQYGLDTAGIIDIRTKSGAEMHGGAVSLYGGSHGTVQPSIDAAGTTGSLSYFVAGDMLRSDLGIESPDGRSNPIHDHTTQYHGFGYVEDALDDHDRLALLIGSSVGKFQIPNLVGEQPSLGLSVNGHSSFPSAALNENQREITQFGALSWLHRAGRLRLRSSLVARYSSLTFEPDPLGDLLYNGIAQSAYKRNVAFALQSDARIRLDRAHTLRAGLFVQQDRSTSDATSLVLPTDAAGVPLGDVPLTIIANGGKTEQIESLYVQDEWRALPHLTVNYGLRYDRFAAYARGNQVSPRANLVWRVSTRTTLHAGYARYFSPPPFELVGASDLAPFAHTTAAPLSLADTLPQAERANDYDVGVSQAVTRRVHIGVDTYYKQSVNLIDEGQFGAPIILTPFNYRYGKQYGAALSASYTGPALQAYLNFAAERAIGKQIDSAQFNFTNADLAYIAHHYIDLDHEQRWTGSGGVSYRWRHTRASLDFLWGSGLRADLPLPPGVTTPYGGTGIPNGAHLPYYTQINVGVSHRVAIPGLGQLTVRMDVMNLLDARYPIRNGTGVGVGAPQYGPRRGVFFGISDAF